jgi:hypothetical protein
MNHSFKILRQVGQEWLGKASWNEGCRQELVLTFKTKTKTKNQKLKTKN